MKRLDIGYIDLYLIHWPKENNIETYLAMEELYGRKEARNIGVSNFNVRHLSELLPAVSVTPAVNQIEFHPLLQQPELFGYCERSGISVEAWSPLGRGRLLDNPAIKKLAEKYGCTTAQIILRWNLQRGIITIPKSTHRQRMEENLNVSGFALSPGDVETVNRMDEGKRFGPDPETVDF